MKKTSLTIFISALAVGLLFSANCNFNPVKNLTGVKGSGTSKTEQRNVSDFTEIEANGAVNLEIDAAQSNFSVTVEADDNLLQFIKTEVSGDKLKVYSEGKISPTVRLNVKISMPALESLDINGASSAKVANVKADSLDLKANGASEIIISGEAKELKADANGASKINADNLRAEDAEVEANGASSATVLAIDDLKLEASGASKISYLGDPKNVKQNSSGASSISKK